MAFSRRELLKRVALGVAAVNLLPIRMASGANKTRIKAIAFDAFPIFDPRLVFALAEQLFPTKGEAFSSVWRTRQFEYQWLRALSGQYADFWQATEDGLIYAADALKLDLTEEKRRLLMTAYLQLKAWPDVASSLETLKKEGIRLALLSNATPAVLHAGIKNSSLERAFEHVLSTDGIKTYKPDRRAYQMAIDAFGLPREEILFVAFAGWDAAGAKAFGYPTYWVNRMNLPQERLGVYPDGMGHDLKDLLNFANTMI